MKLTTKQIMLILMSVLILLVIVMGILVASRVSGLFTMLAGPDSTTDDSTPSSSQTTTTLSTAPSSTTSTAPTESTAPHEHNFVKSKTKSATCEDFGYTVYSCSCGKDVSRDIKDALGHNFGAATVVPATCEQDGYTEQTCKRCGITQRSDTTKAGHRFSEWAAANTSHGNPATQQQRTCSTCKVIELRNTATPDAWTIRKYAPLEEKYGYAHCKIVVVLPDGSTPTFHVYDKLADSAIYFDYNTTGAQQGLTLTYSVNGVPKSYSATSANITIKSDGTGMAKEPEQETQVPTTPSTPDPSTPTPGPSSSTTPSSSTNATTSSSTAATESTGSSQGG